MKNSRWMKVPGILGILIMLFINIAGTLPVMSAGNSPPTPSPVPVSKVSSLLSLHIKIKQAQSAKTAQNTMEPTGIDSPTSGETTLVNKEQVFLHFAQQPTAPQIGELNSLGVTVFANSWIPPAGNEKTGFILAEMPVERLDALAAKDYVVNLDTAEQISTPQNDQARTAMNVGPVWDGGDTGAGVTVAVLDSGIDTSNPDFPPLNTSNSKDYSNYPTLDDTITNTVTGHGTHVTGSLLGRGVNASTYKGVAPGANLVFLKIGNDTNGSASSSAIVYALRDAVDVYHAKIINISYGGWSQYHDGSDQQCQAVDYATSQGATVFVAAGNSASNGWHYSGTVAANSSADIPITVASGSSSYLAVNLVWYDANAHNSLGLQYYDSNHTLLSPTGSAQSQSSRGTESLQYGLTNAVNSGTYYLCVQNNSASNQLFHIYYLGGTTAIKFSTPDTNYTLISPAEADSAIAVGADVSRSTWTNFKGSPYYFLESVGSIATFSGRGPRVDIGAPGKPDITAPGSSIISVRDSLYISSTANDPFIVDDNGQHQANMATSNYFVMEGTSMASPMAAGVGALILSKNPSFTPAQVKNALETTASKANSGWDNSWGWGLINAASAIFCGYPSVTTTAATNLATNSATLNGNLTSLGTSSGVEVSFDWGIDTNYTGGNIVGVTASCSAPSPFTANLTGLTPGQTYYYRAKAVGNGTAYGAEQTFTTLTSPAATVNISVVLQGGSRPDSGWIVPLTVKFFTPGANMLTATPLYSFNLTTAKSGTAPNITAIAQATGITPGTYDIAALTLTCLTNVKQSVVISSSTDVNLGTLLEGDANGDGIINIQDFGVLVASYSKSSGNTGYDPRADFNRDGIVNISDFGLLVANYGKTAPVVVTGP